MAAKLSRSVRNDGSQLHGPSRIGHGMRPGCNKGNRNSFGNTYLTTVPLPDGQYSYEVWGYNGSAGRGVVTTDEHDIKQRLDNGRDPGARPSRAQPETRLEDGYFQMINGQVFVDKGEVER